MTARPDPAGFAAARGYVVTYRSGTAWPGCGGANWHVGRSNAECAFCGTAIPLAEPQHPQIEESRNG